MLVPTNLSTYDPFSEMPVSFQDQYMFIHDVLVEYLMGGGRTELTDENILSYVASLTSSSNGVVPHDGKIPDSCSTLEKQFKVQQTELKECALHRLCLL